MELKMPKIFVNKSTRFDPELWKRVIDWANEQGNIRSDNQAINELVKLGLEAQNGGPQSKETEQESNPKKDPWEFDLNE